MSTFSFRVTALCLILLSAQEARAQSASDIVHGDLIQFNPNGAWCWYQDERVIVDQENNRLVLGSDGSGSGLFGEAKDGSVDAVIYELDSGASHRFVLRTSYSDDHNVPAFLQLPNGAYLTMYADHYDTHSRHRIYSNGAWSEERLFEWNLPGRRTYSNLFYLADEDVVYNFSRADRENPHVMVSRDLGVSWTYMGLLSEPDQYIGYVNGYFKYWSNGKDRIDFVATEYHPRDYNTSLYHGYIKGGKTYDSFGTVVDESLSGAGAPRVTDLTPVFLTGTMVNGLPMTRIWNNDLVRYEDGTLATLFKARSSDMNPAEPSNNPDHVFFYARFNGSEWSATYLGRAGKKLYGSEQDYTGLGALDPNDPTTIYISTPYDPRDDADLGVHEIFRGTTTDEGTSWAWTPVTENSTRDNLRPVVPAWDEDHTALLWFRGTYFSAQRTDAAVVGIIEDRTESAAFPRFIDATVANTRPAGGSPLDPTGPVNLQGDADGRWHLRSGYGNGGYVLASSERDGEDAPVLRTELPGTLETGTYGVWVNFWGKPRADWRIRAGLSEQNLSVYRHMASQSVDGRVYSEPLNTSQEDLFLYRAYLGRIEVETPGQIHYVYVDDFPVETGTLSPIGDTARTWYDGITVARVGPGGNFDSNPWAPAELSLHPNFPNPFRASTKIVFDLDDAADVTLDVFDMLGRRVETLHEGTLPAGTHARSFDGRRFASGLYFYRLRVGARTEIRRMVLSR